MKRYLFISAAWLALVCFLAILGVILFLKIRLPDLSGTEKVQGIQERIEIITDQYGIPHVKAESKEDLYFALGYLHARDRLFQMEFLKRISQGRLSELIGEDGFQYDSFIRSLGLDERAEAVASKLDPESKRLGEQYLAGLNHYIRNHVNNLPVEFLLMKYRPGEWSQKDLLVYDHLLVWSMHYNFNSELLYQNLRERLGKKRARELLPFQPSKTPSITGDLSLDERSLEKLFRVAGFLEDTLHPSASNNWVLHGSKTESGKPILVEDPHGHNPPVPSPFYAVHLVSPDWEVFGLSAPGMPFFQHAYNRHVAYGSTTAGSDIQDLYIEKVNPDNPDEYLYRGRWKKFNRRYETIRVKDVSGAGGFREEKIHILSTLHGPVIHDKREDRERKVLSLKWFAFDERIIRSMREMSEARTVEEFFRAAEGYVSGAENFLVADSSGSIGYICAGYYPLRPSGTVNWFPLPGWTGEHEWQGGITGRDLPRIINPGKGFLASANNRIASKKTEQKLEGMVASHHRFSRIVQLLSKRNKVSCQYSKKMLGDTRSLFAEEMVSLYLRELEGVDTSAVNQIRGYLLDWDFSMSRDSVAATVFHHLTYELMRETFIDELGQNNTQKYLKKWYRALGRWVHILKDSEDWIDDTRTPDRETRKDLLLRACDSTIGNLTKDFGENGKHWTWGKVHTLSYRHRPMDEGGWLLRKVFSLGSFSVGGDMDTINRASYSIAGQKSSDKFLDVNNSSSFRLIVDFARPDEVLFVQSTGQSEHLISPHRSDHLKTMLEGDLFTINLDIGFVKKRTEGVRILMPAGE